MNDKIRDHMIAFCEAKGWANDNEGVVETIQEGKEVWSGNEVEHRHWIEFDKVVEINGMYIQFTWAKGAGDQGLYDAGWEFDADSIFEVQPKEVKTIIYEAVKETEE